MMSGHNDRTPKVIGLHSFQRSFQKVQLRIAQIRILVPLRGNNPGILEAIAIKTENPHKGCLKCEIDAGLDLSRANQPSSLRSAVRRFSGGAEVSAKCL